MTTFLKTFRSYTALSVLLLIFFIFLSYFIDFGRIPGLVSYFVVSASFFLGCFGIFQDRDSNLRKLLVWLPFIMLLIAHTFLIRETECPKYYFLLFVTSGILATSLKYSKTLIQVFSLSFISFSIFVSIGVFLQMSAPGLCEIIRRLILSSDVLRHMDIVSDSIPGYPGFLHQTSHTSLFLVLGIYCCFFMLSGDSVRRTFFKNFLIFIFFVALVFQCKRFHLIVGSLLLFVVTLLSGIKQDKRNLVYIFFFGIFSSGLIYLFFPHIFDDATIFERLSESMETLQNGGTLKDIDNGRTGLGEKAFLLFQEKPWTGIGWGEYSKTMVRGIWQGRATTGTGGTSAHNVYLQLLAETGILGLSTFVVLELSSLVATIASIVGLKNNSLNYKDETLLHSLLLSLIVQIFFCTYCFSENPLYNNDYLTCYLVVIVFSTSVANYNNLGNNFNGSSSVRRQNDSSMNVSQSLSATTSTLKRLVTPGTAPQVFSRTLRNWRLTQMKVDEDERRIREE